MKFRKMNMKLVFLRFRGAAIIHVRILRSRYTLILPLITFMGVMNVTIVMKPALTFMTSCV